MSVWLLCLMLYTFLVSMVARAEVDIDYDVIIYLRLVSPHSRFKLHIQVR